jgi:hypothetical protein
MTSMGDMSAASTTTPWGSDVSPPLAATPVGDLRSDFTTSLTPRLRDLFLAAALED